MGESGSEQETKNKKNATRNFSLTYPDIPLPQRARSTTDEDHPSMHGRLSLKDIRLGKAACIVGLFTAGKAESALGQETSVVVAAFLCRYFLLEYMASKKVGASRST